jgi:hypothetical protein
VHPALLITGLGRSPGTHKDGQADLLYSTENQLKKMNELRAGCWDPMAKAIEMTCFAYTITADLGGHTGMPAAPAVIMIRRGINAGSAARSLAENGTTNKNFCYAGSAGTPVRGST